MTVYTELKYPQDALWQRDSHPSTEGTMSLLKYHSFRGELSDSQAAF